MTTIHTPDPLLSNTARKKFGRPNKYGQAVYGMSRYGEDNDYAGIYQLRHWAGRQIQVKEKFYWPTETAERIANPWRTIFANAVHAWQELDFSQKANYNTQAVGLHKSGYNFFISQQIKA